MALVVEGSAFKFEVAPELTQDIAYAPLLQTFVTLMAQEFASYTDRRIHISETQMIIRGIRNHYRAD